MATPYRIQISAANTGHLASRQTESTAAEASELLQRDLKEHHVYFNESGFHNHIVHHVLALFGTGAGPEAMRKGYERNASYQRPAMESHSQVADDLHDWAKAQAYLGKEEHYSDFLLFYQREIEKMGWQATLTKHLFSSDDRSVDLLQRMFAGFLHPMIQLMYGMEWEQPAIVAQGLAQAAVHGNKLQDFLMSAEKMAASNQEPMPPILDLIEAVKNDEKLSQSAHPDDDNKIYDGVLVRAPDEALRYTSKVKVSPTELDEKTAEMFHAAIHTAASAAMHPTKEPRVDFFLMHHVNSSPIFLTINAQDWIPENVKIRILEWKIRLDIVQYAARGCPAIRFDQLSAYQPKDEELVKDPEELLPRFYPVPDDGHTIKLVRAILICRKLCQSYEGKAWAKITPDVWLKIVYMALDATEHVESGRYVQGAGFDHAWKDIPDRK